MSTKVVTFLLTLLLAWFGWAAQGLAAPAPVSTGLGSGVAVVTMHEAQAATDPTDQAPADAPRADDPLAQLVAELPADVTGLLPAACEAPIPALVMAPPGPHRSVAWQPAYLGALQRPPDLPRRQA